MYFPSEKTLVEMGVTLKNENEDKIRETGVAHTESDSQSFKIPTYLIV